MKLGGQKKPLVIGSGSRPVTEHKKLKGLSYEESGHTGFQKEEEGKGLSANDFTDKEKAHLENLDGAYVFIGTYYEFSKLPYYTVDIKEGITPVFNYQGDKIEYTQPYGGAPYLITVKDSGMTGCEDGVTRAYFTVPQNEGILFKQGMILQMNLKNQEQYLVPIHSVYDTLLDSNDVLGEIVVKIVLEQTEMFSSDISTVGCQPKATFRTGDNVAIIKVAGNVFYEVLSHDYGEEIEGLRKQISTGGGSVDLSGYATTEYVDNLIGDISAELDEVIEIQEEWINPIYAELPVEPDNGKVEEI